MCVNGKTNFIFFSFSSFIFIFVELNKSISYYIEYQRLTMSIEWHFIRAKIADKNEDAKLKQLCARLFTINFVLT